MAASRILAHPRLKSINRELMLGVPRGEIQAKYGDPAKYPDFPFSVLSLASHWKLNVQPNLKPTDRTKDHVGEIRKELWKQTKDGFGLAKAKDDLKAHNNYIESGLKMLDREMAMAGLTASGVAAGAPPASIVINQCFAAPRAPWLAPMGIAGATVEEAEAVQFEDPIDDHSTAELAEEEA